MKRVLDVVGATLGLIAAAPVLALAALGIRLSGQGAIVYAAQRVGRDARPFTMFKLRTMHAAPGSAGSAITAHADPRVFALGVWLRRLKVDELPQLMNILRGDMSLVGPRPEDPRIVHAHYGSVGMETLRVRPGLTSPGTLFAWLNGEALISTADPEGSYVRHVLPTKLALDAAYVRTATLALDVRLVARTAWLLLTRLAGSTSSRLAPDVTESSPLT